MKRVKMLVLSGFLTLTTAIQAEPFIVKIAKPNSEGVAAGLAKQLNPQITASFAVADGVQEINVTETNAPEMVGVTTTYKHWKFEKGISYIITLEYKTQDQATAYSFLNWRDESTGKFNSFPIIQARQSEDWQKVSATFTPPCNLDANLLLRAYMKAPGDTGKVSYRNITVDNGKAAAKAEAAPANAGTTPAAAAQEKQAVTGEVIFEPDFTDKDGKGILSGFGSSLNPKIATSFSLVDKVQTIKVTSSSVVEQVGIGSRDFSLKKGETYAFQFDYKTSGDKVKAIVFLSWYDGTAKKFENFMIVPPAASKEWEAVNLQFNPENDINPTLQLRAITMTPGAAGSVDYRSLKIIRLKK